MSEKQQNNEVDYPTLKPTMRQASPGAILRSARNGLKLSQEDIAKQLRLTVGFVNQLEQDNYAEMTGATYIKGYLRAYAKAVNISPEDIVRQFDALDYQEEHHTLMDIESNNRLAPEHLLRWVSYLVVVVLIGLMVFWWRKHASHTASVIPLQTSQNAQDVGLPPPLVRHPTKYHAQANGQNAQQATS